MQAAGAGGGGGGAGSHELPPITYTPPRGSTAEPGVRLLQSVSVSPKVGE